MRGALALGALVVAAAVAALALVSSLDQPWIKWRLRALALAGAGLDVDYGAVRIGVLSSLAIDDLVVRSPAALRGIAPELLRIGRIRARWSTATLLGAGALVRVVDIEHVVLTVVVDEHGKTSFDAISGQPAPAAKSATALSHLPSELMRAKLPVNRTHIADVRIVLVRTEHGKEIERDTLRGLSLDIDTRPRAGVRHLHAVLGSLQKPLALELVRQRLQGPAGTASARAMLALDLTPSAAQVALDVRVVHQDLVPGLAIDRLAQFEANAKFEPTLQRTQLNITRLALGDGAVTARASLIVPDTAAPSVRQATGDVDAVHLLQFAPVDLLPVRLQRGQLHYRIEELALDRPDKTGALALDGELAGVELTLADGSLALGATKLSLHARPDAAGLAFSGNASLDGLRLVRGDESRLSGDGLALEVTGKRDARGALTGSAALRFARLSASGPGAVVANDGRLELTLRDLLVDSAAPLSARGDVAVDAQVTRIELSGTRSVAASALHLRLYAPLVGGPPFALDGALHIERLQWAQPDPRALVDTPLRIELALQDVSPNAVQPWRSQGVVHLEVEAGALRAELDATNRADALDFALNASAGAGALRAFLPEASARRVPLAKLAFDLRTNGSLMRLSTAQPVLRQSSALKLTGAAFDTLATRTLALTLSSAGTQLRGDVHADIQVEGLRSGENVLGDEHLALVLQFDRTQPSLQLELSSDRLPKSNLNVNVAFDGAARALRYEVAAQVSELAPLIPLLSQVPALAGLELSPLELQLVSRGRVVGMISGVDTHGDITLAPNLAQSVSGHATLDLRLAHARWSLGDHVVNVPAAHWTATLDGQGSRRTIESDLEAEALELRIGPHRVTVSGLHDQTTLSLTGAVANGSFEHSERITIRNIKQRIVPLYELGELSAVLRARRSADGSIKISELRVENRAGGSALSIQGGFDLSDDRQRLSLRTTLQQDLARVSNRREDFVGSGKLVLDVSLASPDFHLFHTRAKLQLEGASVRLPAARIALESVDGEVPILSDWTLGPEGVEFLRGAQVNPYAAQRFADQHPMLSQRSFLSIAKVTTPFVSVAPFAANLKVERNIVSLSQMELGVHHGTITGNGILEWAGPNSKIEANIRASDVQSSHGEPFDGNAALVMDIRDRSIEGRADILRIGKRHLLDLLDLQDPRRTDAAMNQIRGALRFGYPDRVRIAFKHGFASAGVEMGGLARMLKIRDIRGIPMGPLLEQVISSFNPDAEEP